MAIPFHCEHCGAKIDAPAGTGGRWGKCPACHNRVYIPLLEPAPDDDLRLAPLDETEEERESRLLAETFQLTQEILQEKAMPEEETEDAPAPTNSMFIPMEKMGDKDLAKEVVRYLRLVADGDLDKASEVMGVISAYGRQTLAILDRIALGEILDPQLATIPPQVLSGLIRNLRSEL
jgi:hypothetical protein